MMTADNVQVIDNRVFLTGETNIMKIYIDTNVVTVPKSIITSVKPNTIEWKIPKPSVNYMYEFIRRAAHIYNIYKSEMEIFMLWDLKNKKHNMFIPKQTVTGATVNFEWNIPKDHILMFELHSHHTMSVSFSGTDTETDSSLDILPHISLVLKNIDKFNMLAPDKNIDIRLSYLSNKISLKLDDLFEFENYHMPQIEKEIITYPTMMNTGILSSASMPNNIFYSPTTTQQNTHNSNWGTNSSTKYIKSQPQESTEDILAFVNKQLNENHRPPTSK